MRHASLMQKGLRFRSARLLHQDFLLRGVGFRAVGVKVKGTWDCWYIGGGLGKM